MTSQPDLLYADRDPIALDLSGDFYTRHVSAMTREGLHAKSAIAAELAHRDRIIDTLRRMLKAHPAQSSNERKDFAQSSDPVGEIVGTEKRGFVLMTIVRWEPGFNRTEIGTRLYAAPPDKGSVSAISTTGGQEP